MLTVILWGVSFCEADTRSLHYKYVPYRIENFPISGEEIKNAIIRNAQKSGF